VSRYFCYNMSGVGPGIYITMCPGAVRVFLIQSVRVSSWYFDTIRPGFVWVFLLECIRVVSRYFCYNVSRVRPGIFDTIHLDFVQKCILDTKHGQLFNFIWYLTGILFPNMIFEQSRFQAVVLALVCISVINFHIHTIFYLLIWCSCQVPYMVGRCQ